MEIRVKKATGSPEKTTATIEISDLPVTKKTKQRIIDDVGDFLVESVLSSVGKAQSPVAGEDWPELSPGYKKLKKDDGLPGKANMEFEGDMLDALEFRATKDGKGLEIGFWGKEAWKADGHLKFSGKDNNTPKRRFLPSVGDEFVPKIQQEVERIVADAMADEITFDKDAFDSVSTKTDLYETLGDFFPDMSRVEIKSAITRAPKLLQVLEAAGVLELL